MLVEQIVRLGDQVVQRAAHRMQRITQRYAGLAERHTAIHAATCLFALFFKRERKGELLEIVQ